MFSMTKIKKHILIVRTSIKKLSSMSLDSALSLQEVLSRTYANVAITNIDSFSDLEQLVQDKPDLVFLGMKQLIVENDAVWLADYLDEFDINYTGSMQRAHALELNKSHAKARVFEAGLQTSPYYVAARGQVMSHNDMTFSYPVFIKPTDRGGGSGIDDKSVARNLDELNAKIASISAGYNTDSLIEHFLDGREFSVAILRNANTTDYMVMPLELIAPANDHGDRMLSAAVKSADTEEFIAMEDGTLKESVSELGLNVFNALGARDYGRIDIRLDGMGRPHFLEANLMPSILKDYGNFPKACFLNGLITYEQAMLHIVDLAFERTNMTPEIIHPMLLSATYAGA